MISMGIEISPAWYIRTKESRMALVGSNCQSCEVVHFPGRPVCPEKNCGNGIDVRGKLFQSIDITLGVRVADLEMILHR
jgi:hypothetical protein